MMYIAVQALTVVLLACRRALVGATKGGVPIVRHAPIARTCRAAGRPVIYNRRDGLLNPAEPHPRAGSLEPFWLENRVEHTNVQSATHFSN